MSRPALVLIFCAALGCKSLAEQHPASLQFMQLATESKSHPLADTAENERLWSGIASIDSDQTCTAVLIGGSNQPDAPAYLLTAGHCLIDFDDVGSSNRIFRDALPRSDRNAVHFPRADFHIGRVLYATMKGLDLALAEITEQDIPGGIFRLTERQELDSEDSDVKFPSAVTLGRLAELGIHPLPLASALPQFGARIRVLSAPLKDDGERAGFLREHSCRHEGLTDIIEGIWHWYDLARNNCEDIFPGTSGAPVITADGAVFAIINTSSRNALSQDCYTGQPCELTEQGFQVALARNYGSTLIDLSRCFDAQGVLALEQDRCLLDQSNAFPIARQIKTPVNPQRQKAEERVWNVDTKASGGWHYKTGPLPRIDCRAIDQYSGILAADDRRLLQLPLPEQSGLHALCLVSDEQYRRRDLRQATLIVVNVDDHPPVLKPRLVMNPASQEPLMAVRKSCPKLPAGATLDARKKCAVAVVSFEAQPYEIVDFYHGWIGAKDKDCTHITGVGQGAQAHIPVSALPANVCVWAVDGAGNRSTEPAIHPVRAATRREIIEATDVMVDWSLLDR